MSTKMEDGVLSVARALLENKVVVQRPPSGLKSKRSLALNYQKELSRTSQHKSEKLELFNTSTTSLKEKSKRRVQSAKPRIEHDNIQGSTDNRTRRIKSAQPKLSGNNKKNVQKSGFKDLLPIENFELTYEPPGKGRDRPSSAKSSFSESNASYLKPSVYSLEKNCRIYGSEPDLSSYQEDESNFPFKMSSPTEITNSGTKLKRQSQMAYDPSRIIHHNGRPIPKSLWPLIPWLSMNASTDVTGVEADNCLVFLPCLSAGSFEDLPTVPSLQHVDDELPYHDVIYKPQPPWKPKKYKHPSWDNYYDEFKRSKRRHSEIFSEDGRLLHIPQKHLRTADVIKREIRILENLLKGVGTYEGSCVVAHLQADITNLHTMAGETLAMVDERPKTPEPPDLTGLRAFYKEHDEVITNIKLEHQLCMEELAKLEETGDAFVSYTDSVR